MYRLPNGRIGRNEDSVSFYPSEWDLMPPPGCYFSHKVEAEGIPASQAIDKAIAQSPVVVLEALAGSGKTVTARALCQRRDDMVYFDCPATGSLWLDVHNAMRQREGDTILVLDGFDDIPASALADEVTRLTAMVNERGARAIIVTRPFAIDCVPALAKVPRVFLRSVADPAEPSWRRWLTAWNEYAADYPLVEDEISGLQIEGLVAVPIVHQLFAMTKDDVIARYRYDDDLLDALSCDILEAFFSSYAIDSADIALLPKAQMSLLGEIAWAMNSVEGLTPGALAELCKSAGIEVSHPDGAMGPFSRILFQRGDRIQFRQRTFREYLTAWYWSSLLSEMCRGSAEMASIARALGAAPIVRPGDRCLAFLSRLTGDWPAEEHVLLVKTLVRCLVQRIGTPTFRYNVAWVLSSQHYMRGVPHWTIPDPEPLRELLESCALPIALRGLSLPEANLSGLAAPYGDFTYADLSGVRLVTAKLHRAIFNQSILTGADLSHADLRQASFRDADLRGAKLAKADLRGADFNGADLTDADVSGALYDGQTLWPNRYNPQN